MPEKEGSGEALEGSGEKLVWRRGMCEEMRVGREFLKENLEKINKICI